jgi:hypothetical protein
VALLLTGVASSQHHRSGRTGLAPGPRVALSSAPQHNSVRSEQAHIWART